MRRRSGAAAFAVLALFVALELLAGERLFAAPRLALFDFYARQHPRERSRDPVVIVAVDDASVAELGQWPWPRQRLAQLVDEILKGGPEALGIDLFWSEPDRLSPRRWMQQADPLPRALAEEIAALPDPDEALAAALGEGRVVIGVAGQREGGPPPVGPLAPVRVIGAGPGPDLARVLPSYDSLLRSLPELDRRAHGHGLLTADHDDDGVIRRMPLVASAGGRLAPGFGVEILRLATSAPWIDLRLDADHVTQVGVGRLAIPTQADGSVWIHFSPHDPSRFVSAADVLAGRTSPDRFDHKLVILGVTGFGLVDLQITPLGPMVGSEIHAQWLENAVDGRWPRRPAWAELAEAALTAVVGLLLVAWLPALPLRGTFAAGLLALAMLGALGIGAWRSELWLIDVATPAIGTALVFVALLGGTLAEADAQRRRLRRELEAQRLAAAKLEGELAAAARIQNGMLPKPSELARDPRFDLAASLEPARHVGGDLYDFFLVAPDRLFLSIGDVSGKGVPASLFMALGKTLCRSCALRGEHDPGEIVRLAERELARENPELMFITLFAGILDLATGELRFCNAGHEAPLVVRPGSAPRPLETKGGPPLCAVDGFPYATESVTFAPGEILCLFTDGVTEATSRAGERMGRARTREALSTLPQGASASEAVAGLRRAVDAFRAGAELSDDLALLAVRWLGPAR